MPTPAGKRKSKETPRAPSSPAMASSLMTFGRYETEFNRVLGVGASSVVREGTDQLSGETVALKIYRLQVDQSPKEVTLYINQLRRVYASLKGDVSLLLPPKKEGGTAKSLTVMCEDLFLKLLMCSDEEETEAEGSKEWILPGTELKIYCALELAEFSLADYISDWRKLGKPIPLEDLRDALFCILLSTFALEQRGLVHLDIKPENVMLTSKGKWVLSDLDGVVLEKEGVNRQNNTCAFTSLYASPELADELLGEDECIQVEHSMDIWAVGLCASDMACSTHLLDGVYNEIMKKNNGDPSHFLLFVADKNFRFPDFSPLASEYGEHFPDFLNQLLNLDPSKRSPASRALLHPFLATELEKSLASSPSGLKLKSQNSQFGSIIELPLPSPMGSTLVKPPPVMIPLMPSISLKSVDLQPPSPSHDGLTSTIFAGSTLMMGFSKKIGSFPKGGKASVCSQPDHISSSGGGVGWASSQRRRLSALNEVLGQNMDAFAQESLKRRSRRIGSFNPHSKDNQKQEKTKVEEAALSLFKGGGGRKKTRSNTDAGVMSPSGSMVFDEEVKKKKRGVVFSAEKDLRQLEPSSQSVKEELPQLPGMLASPLNKIDEDGRSSAHSSASYLEGEANAEIFTEGFAVVPQEEGEEVEEKGHCKCCSVM